MKISLAQYENRIRQWNVPIVIHRCVMCVCVRKNERQRERESIQYVVLKYIEENECYSVVQKSRQTDGQSDELRCARMSKPEECMYCVSEMQLSSLH